MVLGNVEKMNRKILSIVFLVSLLSLMVIPFASATTYTFGVTTTSGSSSFGPAANQATAIPFTPTSGTDATMKLISFYTYLDPVDATGVKAVIWNGTGSYEVLKVSDQIMYGTEGWYFFTFDNGGDFIVYNNTAYRIGIIGDGHWHAYPSAAGNSLGNWLDDTNSFTSPTAMSNAPTSYMTGYIQCATPDAPTPTPAPTASPTPADISWGIWATLSPYSTLIFPLIIILIVAILCGKFGGVWGFFAGLNVSCILIYAVMGATYFPLWGIVILGIVDGLLLFGKISGRV